MNRLRAFGRRAVAAAVLSICAAPTPGFASPAPPKLIIDKTVGKVAGWSIGVSDSLGGCVAAAAYGDGTTLWFGFSGEENRAYVAFTNPKWRSIEVGQTYSIRLFTRERSGWRGTFVGFDRDGDKGIFASGLQNGFISDLSDAAELGVDFEGRRIASVSLVGSTDALRAVMSCQKDFATTLAKANPSAPPPAKKEDKREDGSSQGTGFFVSTRGHVLTNNHVIKGCQEFTITQNGLTPVPARVIAKDAQNDLALLGTDIQPASVPPLSPRARIGETVYVYGYPLNGILATTGNFTIGNVTATAGLGDDTRQIQISAPVQPGNSGGPLVDSYGNVVGVIVSKLNALKMASITSDVAQNVNFAIKAVIAQNFLEANGIDTTAQPRKTDAMDGAAVAENAKTFTVRVNCH